MTDCSVTVSRASSPLCAVTATAVPPSGNGETAMEIRAESVEDAGIGIEVETLAGAIEAP